MSNNVKTLTAFRARLVTCKTNNITIMIILQEVKVRGNKNNDDNKSYAFPRARDTENCPVMSYGKPE